MKSYIKRKIKWVAETIHGRKAVGIPASPTGKIDHSVYPDNQPGFNECQLRIHNQLAQK